MFSIDSSTGQLVSYDITTTLGSTLGGTEYDPTSAPFVAYGTNSFRLISFVALYINLTFLNPLTSGGIDPIVIGTYQTSDSAKSWECDNCFPIRLVATGEAASSPVPEPSTWATMLIGFAALGWVGYRFSRREGVAA